jgi:hypothetical protein
MPKVRRIELKTQIVSIQTNLGKKTSIWNKDIIQNCILIKKLGEKEKL